MRYQPIWFRGGKAYVPTIGSPPSGMFFELDPVMVLDPSPEAIEGALRSALDRIPVAMPERSRFGGGWPSESVVQRKAAYKTWKAFAKSALSVALLELPGNWQISVGEGSSPETVEEVSVPMNATYRHVAEEIMRIAARRPIWHK